MTNTIHVYDRGKIMRRAWEIARQKREEIARTAYDSDVRIVGSRIIHGKTLKAHLAGTPIDLAGAMKIAWAEAKHVHDAPSRNALIVVRGDNMAPLARMHRELWPMLLTAARAVGHMVGRAA
jgi:hypothetical protein